MVNKLVLINGWINGLIFNLFILRIYVEQTECRFIALTNNIIRSVKTQADLLDEDKVVLTVSTFVDFILIPEKTNAAKVQMLMSLCFN